MSLARFLRIARHRVRSLFRRHTVDAELERELAFHIEALAAEHRAEGLPPAEARRLATRAFGNLTGISDACRDQRRVSWIADLQQDVRYGMRVLRAERAVAAAAILSLALGVGASVAAWRGVDAATRGVLHVPGADRHVVLRTMSPTAALKGASAIDFVAWRDHSQSFDLLAASLAAEPTVRIDDAAPAERIASLGVTMGYFDTIGVRPLLGRTFTREESRLVDPLPAVVISERLWRRRFNADPAILTRDLRLDGMPRPIVGVMPDDVRFRDITRDVWHPLRLLPTLEHGSGRALHVTARLRPGVTAAAAEAELNQIAGGLGQQYPEGYAGWRVDIEPFDHARVSWSYQPLAIVTAIATLVLIVSCANVGSLLFARAVARRHEIRRRIDLGATPGRLWRQWLAEGLVLGTIGGLAGLAVAWAGLRGLELLSPPPGAPLLRPLGLDLRTATIAVVISLMVSVVLGVTSAWATRSRHAAATRAMHARAWLMAAQMAVTLIVLVGSGLLVNSMLRLQAHSLNFDPEGLLTFEVVVPSTRVTIGSYRQKPYFEVTSQPAVALARLEAAFRAVPAVTAVGGSSFRAIDAFVRATFDVEADGRVLRSVPCAFITPGYFATMSTPIVLGRDISAADRAETPWVVIVNETAAAQLWPGEHAIGKTLRLDTVPDDRPRTVVGVVRDIPLGNGAVTASPIVYESYQQQPTRFVAPWINLFGTMTYVVRHDGTSATVAEDLRRAAVQIDPEVPIGGVSPVTERLAAGRARLTGLTRVAMGLALTGIVLAAVGVHGIVSFAVRRQRQEIAVRSALGARPRHIVGLVTGRFIVIVAGGLGAGVVGAALLSDHLSSYLWGVAPSDPLTYVLASALLIGVTAIACLAPVTRALRIAPSSALRCE